MTQSIFFKYKKNAKVMQVLLKNKTKLRFKLLAWLNIIGLFNLNNISKKI